MGISVIDDLKLEIENLKHENLMLKNRCFTQTHGLICVFCPYECENRTDEYQDENKIKEIMEELENQPEEK